LGREEGRAQALSVAAGGSISLSPVVEEYGKKGVIF
jgi:hypothetical protein